MTDDELDFLFSAYLAGPGVFEPDPVGHGETLKRVCQTHRVRGVFPMDASFDPTGLSKRQAGTALKELNKGQIRGADVIIADVTPFRGPSADVGTGWEMGYAEGSGITVFAYSAHAGTYSGRLTHDPDRPGFDTEGRSIEDFDMTDNLMLVGGLEVHPDLDAAAAAAARWWMANGNSQST